MRRLPRPGKAAPSVAGGRSAWPAFGLGQTPPRPPPYAPPCGGSEPPVPSCCCAAKGPPCAARPLHGCWRCRGVRARRRSDGVGPGVLFAIGAGLLDRDKLSRNEAEFVHALDAKLEM